MRSLLRAALTLLTVLLALLLPALPANAGDALIGEERLCDDPASPGVLPAVHRVPALLGG